MTFFRNLARTPLSGLVALLVSLLLPPLAPLPLAAKDDTPPGMARLALEVFINEQPTNLVGDIFRGASNTLHATRGELAELGIAAPGAGSKKDLIALDSLPGLAIRFAETEQKLYLTVPESLRKRRDYDLRNGGGAAGEPTLAPVEREFGLVNNYNLYGTSARGYGANARPYTTGTLTLDSRAFSPYGVLQNSTILGTSLVRKGALRLDTSYVYADRDTALTGTLGDAISGGLSWSRPVRFGGAQISRNFALRPDLVTAPLPSVSGSAAVPSTVDVYVDSMRIASQDVGAGPYRLTNLPVSGDNGSARVVVRDITGKETTTTLPFFTSAKLLAPETLDFSLDIGYPRRDYAVESFSYAKTPMGQGSFRYGLNEFVTLEGHAEGMRALGLAGGGATVNAGRWGVFSLAGAGSLYRGQKGAMVYGAWQGSWRDFFLGLSTQRTFGAFTDVAAASAPRMPVQTGISLSDSGFYVLNRSPAMPRALDRITFGKNFATLGGSLSATFANIQRERGENSRLFSLNWNQTFSRRTTGFVSVYSDLGTRRQTGIVAGLSVAFDDNIIASASGSATRSSGARAERSGSFEIQRAPGNDPWDYGWRLYDMEGASPVRGAQGSLRTPYGNAGAGLRHDHTMLGGYGELDGAVVLSPEGVFTSRRIHDAFAIVDTGAPGVQVLHENRPVTRSNLFGKALVPDLTSYQKARLSIAPETLPQDAHASLTELELTPGLRGSATMKSRTITAKDTARVDIRDAKGQHFPPGTKLVHEESGQSFTIGYGGMTFLTDIADDNSLTITIDTRSCTVRFARADRNGPRGQVGPLTCALQ